MARHTQASLQGEAVFKAGLGSDLPVLIPLRPRAYPRALVVRLLRGELPILKPGLHFAIEFVFDKAGMRSHLPRFVPVGPFAIAFATPIAVLAFLLAVAMPIGVHAVGLSDDPPR